MTRHQERNQVHSEYRAWLATQPCAICGSHEVQLAHVGIGGTGLKHGDDDQCVPLCRECHENHDETKGDFERPCWLAKPLWRIVAPRRVVDAPPPKMPRRLSICGYRTCHTLILSLPGTTPTNRCTEHRGLENSPETDEAFVARVCREFRWRRAR